MNWHLHTSIIGIQSGLLFTVTNFFDPALPESREHICRVVGDIVRRYDIDAIHMDDYFYPYPIKGQDFPDNESFIRYGENFTDKGDWRRNNVNLLIEKYIKLYGRLNRG